MLVFIETLLIFRRGPVIRIDSVSALLYDFMRGEKRPHGKIFY